MTAQEDIDGLVADLARGTDEVKAEIASLEATVAAGGTVDTSALRAAVEALDAVAPAVPAPVDVPPVDVPPVA